MPDFGPWHHWTNRGTFKIEPKVLGGSWHVELWFGDQRLATYSYIQSAAESISRGDHDEALGFPASMLGVPSDFKKWNGFR